jgi:hypothetical protein
MERALTFGEKAVGLTFNPSNDTDVDTVKRQFAAVIDMMDELRRTAGAANRGEMGRLASIAITEAQTAQMWAVKALTWKD